MKGYEQAAKVVQDIQASKAATRATQAAKDAGNTNRTPGYQPRHGK